MTRSAKLRKPSPVAALTGTLVFAVSLLCDSGVLPQMRFVVAQELDEHDGPKDEEERSFRELLQEFERERKRLRRELPDAGEERDLIESDILQHDKLIGVLRDLVKLEQLLRQANLKEDEARFEEFKEQLEAAEIQFERLQQVREVKLGLGESEFHLEEARRNDETVAVEQIPAIIKLQRELLATIKTIHRLDDDRPEELEEAFDFKVDFLEKLILAKRIVLESQLEDEDVPLDKRVSSLIKLSEQGLAIAQEILNATQNDNEDETESLHGKLAEIYARLEPSWDVFELELELAGARKEGDAEAIKELERKLKTLREGGIESAPVDESRPAALPPVRITDADLARASTLDFRSAVFPVLLRHCISCHGNDSQAGDLDLEKAADQLPLVRNTQLWMSVAQHTKNRVMPPEDEPQPTDADRILVAAWLKNRIENFDYSQVEHPGYEPARRLTHQEYANTVRDLFGVPVQVTDKFPVDLAGTSGFDNSTNTLFIQPLLLERYMAAADAVVRQALPARPVTKEQRSARQELFAEINRSHENENSAAQKVLADYLLRAYRKPVTAEETARAVAQFQAEREEGSSVEESLKTAIRSSLISPKFLMKFEQSRSTDQAYAIDDWELASRLSYFLWASMPDDELFQLAREDRLSDSAVLTSQVDRMLADPRADSLGTVFASQWLGFQHLGTRVRADPIDNPWCTNSLMDAMKAESSMFFVSLIRENQPLPRLINAEYTYLNAELAKHYRIPGVDGKQMQRVALSTPNRGGIFTQGSLLAVTSFPGRTSPVVRGKWILEEVLGTPPPPPPPNVSEFSDKIADREALTSRQKLELHRRSPNCYACHSQIDPLGFSLENYDWFGRFKVHTGRRAIDASGKLPDGTEFTGAAGLKQVIVNKRIDDLTRQITRKLLSYALGRQLEYYDEAAVRKIARAVEQDGYRMQTLIYRIVESYPFRYKQVVSFEPKSSPK